MRVRYRRAGGGVAVLLIALVSACGGGGTSHQGYLDHTTLEADLQRQVRERIDTQGPEAFGYKPGTTIESILCVQGSGPNDHVFQCVLNLSQDQTENVEADVSPNGDSYVTK